MIYLTGRNTVLEALKGKRRVKAVYLLEKLKNDSQYKKIIEEAKKRNVKLVFVSEEQLSSFHAKVRQGVLAEAEDFNYAELKDILEETKPMKYAMLAAVDGLEDPQNLGNIIRTAEFFGASGLIIRKKRSVQVTPVVERIAQGAASFLPVAKVSNLRMALEETKKYGFWIAGLEANGEAVLTPEVLPEKCVIVVGGEDSGLSELVRNTCDFVFRLEGAGKTSSLNAASAFAAASYCWRLKFLKNG